MGLYKAGLEVYCLACGSHLAPASWIGFSVPYLAGFSHAGSFSFHIWAFCSSSSSLGVFQTSGFKAGLYCPAWGSRPAPEPWPGFSSPYLVRFSLFGSFPPTSDRFFIIVLGIVRPAGYKAVLVVSNCPACGSHLAPGPWIGYQYLPGWVVHTWKFYCQKV